MITVFIAISNSFIDSGFSQALIREKETSEEDYSTVFYFNLLMSLVLYGVLFICSNSISFFFKEPQLVFILRVLSLVLIINSLGIIQKTILIKNINFKIQTKINITASITSGIVAVFFAYMGYGIWSLVIKTIVMQLVQAILLWISSTWRPTLVFKIDSFKRLFSFGSKLLVAGLIDTIYKNVYFVIIGRVFSAWELGYYTNAVKLNEVASQSITTSVQRVSYPVLSSIQEEKEKLKAGFRKIIKTSVFFNFPIMIGLAAVANPLINILFGYKWMESVPYFQLLCFAGMMYPLHAVNLNVLEVKGRSDLFLRLEIIKKIIFSISIVIVLSFKLGMMGMVGTLVLNSYLAYLINAYYSIKLISYSIKEQIKDMLPMYLASTIMGIAVYSSNFIMHPNNLIKLIIQISLGGVIYISICKLAHIEELNMVSKLLLTVIKKLNGGN